MRERERETGSYSLPPPENRSVARSCRELDSLQFLSEVVFRFTLIAAVVFPSRVSEIDVGERSTTICRVLLNTAIRSVAILEAIY